ncbi:MAG: hypothetical protein KAR79_05620 [Simkaniaceae bacterium]|nr:hypothetical protein [Simkaniaceae bacterium]
MKIFLKKLLYLRYRPDIAIPLFFILGVHFYTLTFFFTYSKIPPPNLPKHIVVRTIIAPKVAIKTETKKVVVSKKPPPKQKKAPEKKTKTSTKNQQMLTQLTKKISKMETPKKLEGSAAPLSIPTKIDLLTIDSEEDNNETFEESAAYLSLLVSELKKSLLLPEFGSVKVELSISDTGSVINVNILASKSEMNKIYLEKEIPLLIFPKKEKKALNKNSQTFIFTFCND